jgi:hypothetical protein
MKQPTIPTDIGKLNMLLLFKVIFRTEWDYFVLGDLPSDGHVLYVLDFDADICRWDERNVIICRKCFTVLRASMDGTLGK